MYVTSESLTIDRWIARLRWPKQRVIAVLAIILILIPFLVAYLQVGYGIVAVLASRAGRHLFFFPLMVTYLIAAIGPVLRTREEVAQALRPLVKVDEERFTTVVDQACRIRPISELIAFGVGVIFFFMIEGVYKGGSEYRILSLYVYIAGLFMFGVIGWSIYAGFTVTRLTNALLRLPVKIDIFDTGALAPIGRQSLYLALVFIGAIILSLFFIVSPDSLQDLLALDNILIYGILIVLTVTIFLLNMYRTHSLLSAAKKEQLAVTDRNLARAYYRLQEMIANDKETYTVSSELNALAASKQELKSARTWPYNTEMLRTLVVSILTPLVVGLARVIMPLFMR